MRLLNLSLSVVSLRMPDCHPSGSFPFNRFPDTCSVCRSGRCIHEAGSVPAVNTCGVFRREASVCGSTTPRYRQLSAVGASAASLGTSFR